MAGRGPNGNINENEKYIKFQEQRTALKMLFIFILYIKKIVKFKE